MSSLTEIHGWDNEIRSTNAEAAVKRRQPMTDTSIVNDNVGLLTFNPPIIVLKQCHMCYPK